jgi:NAD(P)H-hydrate epimerase
MIEVTKEILKNIYKERKEGVRKYDFGLLVVIGGSEFYSGSPAFCALAAFRAGVDMVRIIAPKRAADIIASFKPDLAAYPLKTERLNKNDLSTLFLIVEEAKLASHGKTAVVIGGGMGRSEETKEAIFEFLSKTSVSAVIDADGIYALEKNPEIVSGKPFVITPHLYEFFVLTGKDISSMSFEQKIKSVEEEAKRLNTTIVLKGPIDIISNGEETALNKTGSYYMTKGGMGDTLAGILGALLSRGVSCFEASQAAAYINGLAGEIAIKKFGEGVMASDLIEAIPEVISLYK